MLPTLLSVGAINALVPILIIIVLIGAAAGLTRGFSFLDLFGIGTLMGMGPRRGTKGSLARSGYSTIANTGSVYPSGGSKRKEYLPRFVPISIRKGTTHVLALDQKREQRNRFFAMAYGANALTPKEAEEAKKTGFVKLSTHVPGVFGGMLAIATGRLQGASTWMNRTKGAGYKTATMPLKSSSALEVRLSTFEKLHGGAPESKFFERRDIKRSLDLLEEGKEQLNDLMKEHAAKLAAISAKYGNRTGQNPSGAELRDRAKLDKEYLTKFVKIDNKTTYHPTTERIMRKLTEYNKISNKANVLLGKSQGGGDDEGYSIVRDTKEELAEEDRFAHPGKRT